MVDDMSFPVVEGNVGVTPLHKTATDSGNTSVIAPSDGTKAIRLWWYNLGADPGNSAHVVAALRFGAAGTDFYKTALSQYGAATAHSFKAGLSYHQGAAGEALFINLNVAQTVYCNIDYEEVTP